MSFIEIAIVSLCVFVTVSIVVTTLRIGIPPMPSSGKVRKVMLDALADAPPGAVVDLGSGVGWLAIVVARRFPGRQVIGYELSWVPWVASIALKHLLRLPNLSFRRGDFLQADLSEAAVMVCYLFPRGMQALLHKFDTEGRRPGLLVSNTFRLPGVPADEVVQLRDLYRTRVYVYRWGALAGTAR